MNIVHSLIHRNDPHVLPYTGKNIGIAVLDTGIFPHMDFILPKNRIAAFCDFISGRPRCYDDNGHGTHICGILSGSGAASRGKYCGIAPDSHLIVGKILDGEGNGSISSILEAIRWVIETKELYKTRILNISIGTDAKEPVSEDSVLVQGVNEAWDAGLVVVAAAGNNGPAPMSVTAPGISRKIITVGAADDYKHIYIRGRKISNYSGRGPTRECIQKPDVVAPGSNITSCSSRGSAGGSYAGTRPGINAPGGTGHGGTRNIIPGNSSHGDAGNIIPGNTGHGGMGYTSRSGTSMATPIVSGGIALLLEKYPSMTNKEVKLRLRGSCDDLGLPKSQQGWGMLNLARLLL